MTYAEKFPMLNKNKAFGLVNTIGRCGYAIFPCQRINCSECRFKADVDSEFSLTCRGARVRWLMSACEEAILPNIIDVEKIEDYDKHNHIYPPAYSEPIKVEDEYWREDEDILGKEKELIDILSALKHHCQTSECHFCMLSNDELECALSNNPVVPEEWCIDIVRRIVL